MEKKPKLICDDKNAFQEAMKGVKPLTYTKITPHSPQRHKKRVTLKERPKPKIDTFEFSDFEKLPLVETNDHIQFSRPGIQHKILRKLRLGQYNVEAKLDLHGMTVARAREATSHF